MNEQTGEAMETHTITPSDEMPIRFIGKKIASADGSSPIGRSEQYEIWQTRQGSLIATFKTEEMDYTSLDAWIIEPKDEEKGGELPTLRMRELVMKRLKYRPAIKAMVENELGWEMVRWVE